MINMAEMKNIVRFDIDPSQPVAELCNVIAGVIRLWPGSELDILRGVRNDIDKALEFYESKDEQGKAKQQEAQKERADPA
jgi:hypothetical protein